MVEASDAARAFGVVLRKLRKKAGLTQEQLAEEAELRRTFISILELGQQQPTLLTVIKLATALALPARDVMESVEIELGRVKRRRS